VRAWSLVGLLLSAPVLAQSTEGLHPDEWTQGRLVVTGGAAWRLAEQSRPGGQTVLLGFDAMGRAQATPMLTQLSASGAWFVHPWFGVAADVRVDPFTYTQAGTDGGVEGVVGLAGAAVAVVRWQPGPLFSAEGQAGWAVSSRPLIAEGATSPAAGRATFEEPVARTAVTTGPTAGVALNFDVSRALWLQVYGRLEGLIGVIGAEPYGLLSGLGATAGLQARVASFRVGPIELGVSLLAEAASSRLAQPGLDAMPDRSRVESWVIRAGAGVAATVRRPRPPAVDGPAPARGLTGRVLRADGAPVSGATVVVGATTLTSGADGRFEVTGLSPGTVSVKATAPGLRAASVQVVVADGVTETELVLETPTGPGRLTGVVRAAPDTPLKGAKVVSGAQATTTNATGAYALEAVGPGPVKVRVMLDGYAPADEAVQVPAEGTATLDITLEPATQRAKAKLRGVISSAAGPVAKATVRVVELRVRQAVKADGRFEIDVPGGRYTLVIEAPRHVTQTKQLEVADGDQAIFQIELEKVR
jgi:hypothetical protein